MRMGAAKVWAGLCLWNLSEVIDPWSPDLALQRPVRVVRVMLPPAVSLTPAPQGGRLDWHPAHMQKGRPGSCSLTPFCSHLSPVCHLWCNALALGRVHSPVLKV